MNNNNIQILAVDDEPRGVELVSRALRKVAAVTTATSGEKAWELAQANNFDLVISDQRMPGMSGLGEHPKAAIGDRLKTGHRAGFRSGH